MSDSDRTPAYIRGLCTLKQHAVSSTINGFSCDNHSYTSEAGTDANSLMPKKGLWRALSSRMCHRAALLKFTTVLGERAEKGLSMFLWNSGKLLPDYTVSHPRRQLLHSTTTVQHNIKLMFCALHLRHMFQWHFVLWRWASRQNAKKFVGKHCSKYSGVTFYVTVK
jgi:hypothetical protein